MNSVIKDKIKLAATVLVIALVICYGVVRFDKTGSRNATTEIVPAFDVPSLIGLNVIEITKRIGPASEFTDPATVPHPPDLREWDITFSSQGQTLLVTYDMKTGAVIDFFIATHDPSGATSNLDQLRVIGNLTEKPTRYQLDPVPAGNSGGFTGLKIVPNTS